MCIANVYQMWLNLVLKLMYLIINVHVYSIN